MGAILIDEQCMYSDNERSLMTRDFDYDEIIVIEDINRSKARIYHSLGEVPFAGSVIGAAASVMQMEKIVLPNYEIVSWCEDGVQWIALDTDDMLGGWEYEEMNSPEEIKAMSAHMVNGPPTMYWAWQDKTAGKIYARTFAAKINIPEVEVNGSGSMMLGKQLGRSLRIVQGRGSEAYVNFKNGTLMLGGRVIASGE